MSLPYSFDHHQPTGGFHEHRRHRSSVSSASSVSSHGSLYEAALNVSTPDLPYETRSRANMSRRPSATSSVGTSPELEPKGFGVERHARSRASSTTMPYPLPRSVSCDDLSWSAAGSQFADIYRATGSADPLGDSDFVWPGQSTQLHRSPNGHDQDYSPASVPSSASSRKSSVSSASSRRGSEAILALGDMRFSDEITSKQDEVGAVSTQRRHRV